MKGKRLALLLAVALTVNSMAGAASTVSGADFTSEAVDVEEESEPQAVNEETPVDNADIIEVGQEEDFSSEETDSEVEAEGEENTEENIEVDLEDGSEELFSDDAGDGEESTFIIPDNVPKLSLDTDYMVTIDKDNDSAWFAFTPEKDGKYVFASTSGQGIDPNVCLYAESATSKQDSLGEDDEGKVSSNDFLIDYPMLAGTTYYYHIGALLKDLDSASFTVNLTEFRSVTSIKLESLGKPTLIGGFEQAHEVVRGSTVTITYNDDTSITYTTNETIKDSYGNLIFPMWIENGEKTIFSYESCPEVGKYGVCFVDEERGWFDTNKIYSNTKDVEVIPVTEADIYKGIITEGENNKKFTHGDVFSFTPQKDGRYSFSSCSFFSGESSQLNVLVKKETDGMYPDVSSQNGCYTMEAGITYYIQNRGNYVYGVSVSKLSESLSDDRIEQSPNYKGEVAVGKNLMQKSTAEEDCIVSFTPKKSGKYNIICAFKITSVRTEDGTSVEMANGWGLYELSANKKYYIYCNNIRYDDEVLSIESVEKIKNVTLDCSNVKTSFYEKLSNVDIANAKMTVTYENDEKKTVTLGSGKICDERGNYFFYGVLGENGRFKEQIQDLKEGIYPIVIRCSNDKYYTTSCTIEIKSADDTRQLKEGINTEIDEAWYKFIPEISGTYEFTETKKYMDIYIFNGESKESLSRVDWYTEKPTYSLEKGTTYYIKLWGGTDSDTTLKIHRNVPISAKLTGRQKEHILLMPYEDDVESMMEEIAVLDVQYSDGSSDSGICIDPPSDNDSGEWKVGKRDFKVKIVNADTGEVVDNYYDMEEGNYKLSCTDGNVTSNEVEIHAITTKNFPKLEIGKKAAIKGKQYYIIEPEETAEYIFECKETYGGKEHSVSQYGFNFINIYKIDSESGRKYRTILHKENKGRMLYAGQKYLIWCNDSYWSPNKGTVYVKKYDKIEKLEVISYSPNPLEFFENLDEIKLDSLKARLVYTDGRTRELDINGDNCDGQFHYEIGNLDKSGNFRIYGDGDRVELGKHVIEVAFGWGEDNFTQYLEFEVITPIEMKKSTIKLSTSKDKWTTVKYTPAFTGMYRISANGGTVDSNVYYRDDSVYCGYKKKLTTIENGKCSLTRNQTCYFRIYADEANPEFTVVNDDCQWLEQSRKEPTCTEEGSITSLCKLHGEQKTEKTEALGHEMGEWVISKNATCTENGEKFQKCTRCDLKNTEITEPAGHAWGQWQMIQEATCTSDGIERRICSVCKKTESQTVEATGHAWGEEQTQEAGEDTSGKVYRVCGNCQEEEILKVLPAQKITQTVQNVNTALEDIKEEAVTEEQKKTVEEAVKQITELDNTELLHSEDAIDTITKVENILVRSENQIGETQVEKAESFGNVEAVGAALTAAKEAEDMEETPKVAAKLSVTESAKDYGHIEKDALAMNITLSLINTETKETVEGKEEIQPKAPIHITMEIPENLKGRNLTLLHMKEDGAQENINYQLDKANEKISFSVASLSDYVIVPGTCTGEHTMDESGWTETLRSTCTTEGKMVNKCIICGYEQVKILPLEEHNFSVKTAEGKKPTCTEDGYELYKCQNCEETVSQVLSATGHEMKKVSEKEVSCTADGEITYRCQHEGCSETRTETVPRTAHTWEEKVTQKATCAKTGKKILKCTKCSEEITVVIPYGNDHKFVWKTIKPTYKEKGRKYKECQKCKLVTKTEILEKEKPVLSMNVQANKTIPLKLKQTFNAKVTRMANGDKVSSWKSSNTKVATITSNGKITARKSGTTTIKVKLKSGITSSFKVKVQKTDVAATSITVLNKDTKKKISGIVTLKLKKKLALAVSLAPLTCKQKVTFISSNKKIATVTSGGVITAKKKGTVTITVKVGKKSAKVKIKVK